MANTSAPFGFQQVAGLSSTPTYQNVVVPIASTNTTPIYRNDPVSVSASTGFLEQATAGTAPLAGIFAGCKYSSVSRNGQTVWSNYWPGADAVAGSVEGYVINDPNATFLCQVSGASPVTQANVGENLNFALGTGNTATGLSGASADFGTLGTTATLAFKVMGTVTTPPGQNGTDVSTALNFIIVSFNNVLTKTLTGTA